MNQTTSTSGKTYDVGAIQDICGGTFLQCPDRHHVIKHLLVDSRQLHLPKPTLFFAFRGHKQDGHQYIEQLYGAGVRCFVVSQDADYTAFPEANLLLVPDVLDALQQLARHHRSQFALPVVGITGSNGKTVIKEWLAHLLADTFMIAKSPKSYNSQIGVPLSLWLLSAESTLGLFEAGISLPDEMARLASMIQPTYGIFSNLGSAHDEGFASRRTKGQEKGKLFRDCERVIYCRDHPMIHDLLVDASIPAFSWSRQDDTADLRASVDRHEKGADIWYRQEGVTGQVSIPFADSASIENALHCLAMLIVLGLDPMEMATQFASLPPVRMRLELRAGLGRCEIINDVYNADLESLAASLSFARQQASHGQTTIVLSDLLQQSLDPSLLYRQVADMLESFGVRRLIGVGSVITQVRDHLDPSIEQLFYPDTDALLDALPGIAFSDELVLVKGARSFGLERVTDRLSKQQHRTVLEVHLGALARNIKKIQALLRPEVKTMAMVKAAAYGSGSISLVRFLASRSVDYLAVAYADEGAELRRAGIDLPIMVLNTEPQSLPLLTRYELEPEVFSLAQLQQVIEHARMTQQQIAIHIKLETGMHRLGFTASEVSDLSALLRDHGDVHVRTIFSHLAASDDVAERAFTQSQIQRFDELSQQLMDGLSYQPMRHLANSQAIVHYPEAHFDMVRLGIGMYGIGMPDRLALESVHQLRSSISQIRQVPKGATIGYGRAERLDRDRVIATVSIGYADGLIRKAGNRRYALVVNGHRAPIVGNICMDMTMIDVTGLPDVRIGDPVIVFGNRPTIGQLAEAAGTIPYEVFTRIGQRVKRVYVND